MQHQQNPLPSRKKPSKRLVQTLTTSPAPKRQSFISVPHRCSTKLSKELPIRINTPILQTQPTTQLSTTSPLVMNLKETRLKWAMKKIARRLYSLSIRTQPQKGCGEVKQEWERDTDKKEQTGESDECLLQQSHWMVRILQLVIITAYILDCWYLSIKTAFGVEQTVYAVFCLLPILLLDLFLNLNTVRTGEEHAARTRISIFLDYLRRQSYLDIAIATQLATNLFSSSGELHLALDIIAVVALLLKLQSKAKLLKTYIDHRKHLILIDSILLLMAISHANALLLFLSSKIVPQNSWVRHIGIQDASWGVKYIYSLYWSVTTIVTVGYGDITPQNQYEVGVTILIELLGSALFGYLINVIGMTMTDIRKEKENLLEELSITNKLVKCLPLNDHLAYRLKNFLRDNQKADFYFSLKDEKRIWGKLNPELQQSILQETNIRVLKKCIFFLTHFSRNFQDVIALRLLKRVFQPNELLGFDANNRSLFIIDKGKADLQAVRYHRNKPVCKTLRVINKDPEKDKAGVSSNIVGFTAILLRRRVNLSAICRQFIITYELLQKDFDELVAQYPDDFEVVCELKDQILNCDLPESYEGPELLDPSMHFVPIKHLSIRKKFRNMKRERVSVIRSQHERWSRYGNIGGESIYGERPGNAQLGMDEIISKGEIVSERRCPSLMCEYDSKDCARGSGGTYQNQRGPIAQLDQIKRYNKYFVNANIDTVLAKLNATMQRQQTASHIDTN